MINAKKILNDLNKYLCVEDSLKDPALLEERRKCEESFYYFIQQAWPHMGAGQDFIGGIPPYVICAHLEALVKREIRQLLVNIQPRIGKSLLIGVGLPVWAWIRDPTERILSTSYALELSTRDAVKSRRLIESTWFQRFWGHKVRIHKDQNRKQRIENTAGGVRIATSVGSGNMGEGGDILIMDDPNDSTTVESEVARSNALDWFTRVMTTRVENMQTAVKVVIQQRLHANDISGYIIDNCGDDWTKLILPASYDPRRSCKTVPLAITGGEVWKDPRTVEGQLLWPERFSQNDLDKLRRDLGSYAFAGQYQQTPIPADGGIFNPEHFRWWRDPQPPTCDLIVQAWDTALTTNELSCYSSACTMGIFKDPQNVYHMILLSLWYGRVEMPDLYYMSQRLANNYLDTDYDNPMGGMGPQPDVIMVEEKANGSSLVQMMRRAGISVQGVKPKPGESKITRARIITPHIESGRIWVPAAPPHYNRLRSYSAKLVDSCALFRGKESGGEGIADVVDSFVYAVRYGIDTGYLKHPDDFTPPVKPSYPRNDFYNIYNTTGYTQ